MRKTEILMIIITLVVLGIAGYMRMNQVDKEKSIEQRIGVLESVLVDQYLWPAGLKPPKGANENEMQRMRSRDTHDQDEEDRQINAD